METKGVRLGLHGSFFSGRENGMYKGSKTKRNGTDFFFPFIFIS